MCTSISHVNKTAKTMKPYLTQTFAADKPVNLMNKPVIIMQDSVEELMPDAEDETHEII